ncbi:glycosyltransferase [Halobacillus sp. A1]|uniref:glycosyltransferase n=1 Tax=Halobacillus sp. A1 TaxID=2880262 RepID=UPI0020A6C256|nr:glycosyltransferase [Halobacillus sp. A1]
MPCISVIVPIYNVERYLPACLNSILAQTFTNFELILINDGSEDRCGEICDSFSERDNRIKVIHQKNSGVSHARNEGLKVAKGDYIAFVDPDDTIEPSMYEVMYSVACENEADMTVCRIKTLNLFTGTESKSSIYEGKEKVLSQNDIKNKIIPLILNNKTVSLSSSVNKLYKKSIFDLYNVKFEEHKSHSEDVRLNLKILPHIDRLVYVDEALYNYFIRRNNSLTQVFREDLYDYISDNRKLLIKMCKEYSSPQKLIKNVRSHYASVTLNFIQGLVNSSLPIKKQLKILSTIIKDEEFIKDIACYQSPSLFLKILKLICRFGNEMLIIRVVQYKYKLIHFIR